ncbi:MAG: flagellar filament capping protein FliD [Burkholderiales bacterium]|uniref:flagellar filament capping protein FliD n=1 Tax=Inhella sp. TaxID=1921806 RepID=UPI001ACC66C0|nr:flagellar filament capping protein FliD [Burkholderiales bacterium]
MATITSAGIGSGIDVESLISRLVSLERQPIDQLKQRTDGLKTQLSAIGKLQSSLSTLRDLSGRLSRSEGFSGATASSSDATVFTASAASGAALGNYSIEVSRLAQAQSVASAPVAAGASTGTGTITIELGRYADDLSTFDADPARTSLVIPVVAGQDQLDKIRDQINAMKAGIVANVVSDVNGSRLVMRATDSGAANAFRVTVADDDGNPTDASGLSAFAFDRTAGAEVNIGSLKQVAQNALAKVDGVDIESASNRVEGVVQGVTLNLLKTTAVGSSATLSVAQDKTATKKLVTDFMAAYNDTLKQLRDLTKNDPNGTTGPLKGDQTINSIQFQLRQIAGSSTTLGGTLTRLADIGLDPGSDGSLKLNDSKLEAALDKPDNLRLLFSGVDSADAANSGFGVRLREAVDNLLSLDGRIESRKAGINNRIEANDDRSEALERRVQLVEKRLRAQYTALDGTMGRNAGVASYLQQQLDRL